MSPRVSRFSALLLSVLAVFCLAALPSDGRAQTRGAQLQREQKPTYPESMMKALRQGNVILIGRIDVNGRVQDIKPVASSLPDFVEPAIAAVRAWQFKPAIENGKPVEIAANVGIRFRLDNEQRGQIAAAALGDLAVFPGDASGRRAAPEGFPIHKGVHPTIRVEPVLDVAPSPKPRKVRLLVEALSPSGRRVSLLDRIVDLKAKAAEITFPFFAPVGATWEDGVWKIRFAADGADVGGGQFWIAADPAHFDFAGALRRLS